MEKSVSFAEIIALAVKGEEDAITFYEKVAEIVIKPELRDRCKALAKEEGYHRDMLLKLHSKMVSGDEALPKISGNADTAEGGFPIALNDVESMLQFAIAREEEAEEFYKKAAAKAEGFAQGVFNRLAEIENGHAQTLQIELDALREEA